MWRIGIGLFVFLLLVIFFLPGHGLLHYRMLQKQRDSLARENALLLKKNEELTREIKLLKTDKQTLDRVAREKYGLLKKNEEVYEFKK